MKVNYSMEIFEIRGPTFEILFPVSSLSPHNSTHRFFTSLFCFVFFIPFVVVVGGCFFLFFFVFGEGNPIKEN